MNATLAFARGLANGCHGRPSVTLFGAIEADCFLSRLLTNKNPNVWAVSVLAAVT